MDIAASAAPEGSGLGGGVSGRVAGLLREVVGLVDDGHLDATSSERAHLVGAAAAMELLSAGPNAAVQRD